MTQRPLREEPVAHQGAAKSKLMVGLGGLVLIGLAYLVIAMPGMDHSSPGTAPDAMSGMNHPDGVMGWIRQGPTEFAKTLADDRVAVINVHIPDEGRIAGTDLTIPYTDITDAAGLPRDRDAPLALYCRSGRMSSIAARVLVDAGYRNVFELEGGVDAWVQAGRPLEAPPTLTTAPR